MQLTHQSPRIWTIDDFLSKETCDDLIALSEKTGYTEAEVSLPSGAQMIRGLRNNYRALYNDALLADVLWKKLQPYCPAVIDDSFAAGLNEQFRFYKYESAQRFKRHLDGRFRRNEPEESRITFMIYLNDDFEGGETAFDDVVITPRTGTALCFIHEQKHEGRPVTGGTKYALRSDVMYRMPPGAGAV